MASPPLERTKTPGVYRRGGRYVVRFRDPYGRQRKRFAKTYKEAARLRSALAADVDRGEYRETSRLTLTEYAAEWISTYAGRTSRGLGEGTRDDYRGALEREILPRLGALRLSVVEPRDVKRVAHELAEQGLAPASIKKTIAPLRALLATALEEGLIRSNPAAGVRIALPTPDPGEGEDDERVKALSEEELALVLEALDAEWRPFFEFLFETGLRISEAIEARHRDVDGAWLRVDRRYYRGKVGLPKGRTRRRVPLSRSMAQRLWTMRRDAGPDDLLFASAKGARIDPSNVMSRVLKPAAVAAGLGEWAKTKNGPRAESWVGFHTFRHSRATALFRGVWSEELERYEGGWNAVQVCRFLGHADPGFTLRTYVHLLPEDLPEPLPVGHKWATQAAESGRDAAAAAAVEIAM